METQLDRRQIAMRSMSTRGHPQLPDNIGKRGKCVMPPDGAELCYLITDEVRCFQDRTRSKVIVLPRIDFDDGRVEVRLGYYIIGKKPKMRGRWVWGQYATILPAACLAEVFREAERRGWFTK
jgi:hypothetical protein